MEDDKLIRYCKIIIAISQVLTLTLRDLLKTKIPPRHIFETVNRGSKKQKDNVRQQFELIQKAANDNDYCSLDITLLYCLLQNFTDIPEPTNGWGREPRAGFIRVGDNIERVRFIRNNSYHVQWLDQLTGEKFEEIRTYMIGICERMTRQVGGDLNYAEILLEILERHLIFDDRLKNTVDKTVEHFRQDHLAEIIPRKRTAMGSAAGRPAPKRLRRSDTTPDGNIATSFPTYDERRRGARWKLSQTCSKKNLKKPKSVLLVGPAGVGKSSFINSSITAITGNYCPYAKSGQGRNVTVENNVICCKKYAKGKLRESYLPTFVDMIGLDYVFSPSNDKSEEWLADEIVGNLVDGKYPENTDLWDYAKRRIEDHEPVITHSEQGLLIDVILMVWAPKSGDPLPDKVIACINHQRCIKGRDIPVFVIMTKMDECDVDPDELKNKKNFICEQLRIENSHILECVNYIDNQGWNEEFHSELPILEFLNKICDKVYERRDLVRLQYKHCMVSSERVEEPSISYTNRNRNATENTQSQPCLQNGGDEQQNNTHLKYEADLPSTSLFGLTSGNQTIQKYQQPKTGSRENTTSISSRNRLNMPDSLSNVVAAQNIRRDRGDNTQVRLRSNLPITTRNIQSQSSRGVGCQSESFVSENREHSTSTENEQETYYMRNLPLVCRKLLFVIIVLLLVTFFLFVCVQRS
ncbi:uncharacterized protein LOC133185183 [Saccostrea echinata]|uniref:uncharacterized protein LOC133185183 n=1 Tax=Saccostrea echinata TaxID=191078 RepID=UPI002A8005BE|nr:uncharacterized protein LOC133185183 [Saccostrea echinata]